MTEPIAYYSPSDIATQCGITTRHARRVICSVLGHRTRYRLTRREYARVCKWHRRWGYKREKQKTRPVNVLSG